jgi:aromatic ring-opening dioxygenase catalytic subunit (LigB family)
MVRFLKEITPRLGRPETILVISAHWEELKPMATTGKQPAMIYDYSGFPKESYQISYPAPGNPDFAEQVVQRIKDTGQTAWRHSQRGFDHGLYVPLMIMYPQAEIPCVQLSLLSSLDSESHLNLGKAISEIRQENILVLGSGFSFHNLRALLSKEESRPDPRNDAFQDWLVETVTTDMADQERRQRLIEWERAPSARYCHPREEHLLPLHVCCGMARSKAVKVFDDHIMGKRSVAFLWT